MLIKKIALGTAQFGLKYGVANRLGQPSKETVFDILGIAHIEGVDTLDTAYAYGTSEEIIGEFVLRSGKAFNIISKAPDMDAEGSAKYFNESLRRLKRKKIYGYLIHKCGNLIKNKKIWDDIEDLKKKALVEKIGVSVYGTDELEYLLKNKITVDLIQVPYNIFDQRFDEYLSDLRDKKVEIYARSVFLQGLFFLDPDHIDKRFPSARKRMEALRGISKEHNIPVHALCLCFALINSGINKLVIGVDSPEQLKQNLYSMKYFDKVKGVYGSLRSLKLNDEEVILPYRWK